MGCLKNSATLFISVCGLVLMTAGPAWAETVDNELLADSIFKAENSRTKPYGIMKDYCKPGDPDGQCRKGCLQTIEKNLSRIEHTDANEFIEKFAEVYAPTKGKLRKDEREKNPNWPKNVKYFYHRGF